MAQHIVITAQGTGVDMENASGCQPAAVAAQLNKDLCFWQPLGNYPASVVNPQMGASVQMGVDEMVRLVNEVYPPGNPVGSSIIPVGYSQGAIVVAHFIRDEVLNPRGRCSNRAKDIVTVATWGNPCRPAGFASGNQFAGWPMPSQRDGVTTGGISGPDCLTAEQVRPHLADNALVKHFWGEFVNTLNGSIDLYTECPNGTEAGNLETLIYNEVQKFNITDIIGISLAVFRLVGPGAFVEAMGIAEAIINSGMFLLKGPSAAHFTYDITPIVNFINLAASETPPW